jgi:hypothetical protein
MSMISPVSGPGKFAKREDLSRVKKIQREAKIQNATGGTYGQAGELQDIASAVPTSAPTATSATASTAGLRMNTPITEIQGNGEPVSQGAAGNTPGAGPEVLGQPVDAYDNSAMLARAMFTANPTPANRRLLEAFLQEGR